MTPFNILRASLVAASLAMALALAAAMAPELRAQEFLPLPRVMEIVTGRYVGEITAVEVKPGKDDEETPFVYELRLVTPTSNVLRIRIDALTGDFLEVDGRGLVEARRSRAGEDGR